MSRPGRPSKAKPLETLPVQEGAKYRKVWAIRNLKTGEKLKFAKRSEAMEEYRKGGRALQDYLEMI